MMSSKAPFSLQTQHIFVCCTMLLFAAILLWTIPRHEPWADEAQAWLIAKYCSPVELFGRYIHYEASPGLWHFFLWLLARLHVSYLGMRYVTGVLAGVSAWLVVSRSPFPWWLRIPLPFSYFLIYQYAAIARSYVLFPLLLFLLACSWNRRFEHLTLVAALIGLLANVCLHGMAVAAGLAVVLAWEWFRLKQRPRAAAWSALLLLALVAFAVWSFSPAPDAGWFYTARKLAAGDVSSGAADFAVREHPYLLYLPARTFVLWSNVIERLRVFREATVPRFQVGLLLWALLSGVLVNRGWLRYTLPVLLLAVVERPLKNHLYHSGLIWILFLFLWWIVSASAPPELSPSRRQFDKYASLALTAVVAICVAVHLEWAWRALRYDAQNPYSPNRDSAAVLRKYLDAGWKVDAGIPAKTGAEGVLGEYFLTGVQPYFQQKPLANMPHRFWFWGGDDDMRQQYLNDLAQHPPVVLFAEGIEDERYKTEEALLTARGYRRNEVVCGQVFYPTEMPHPLCHAFYRPPAQRSNNQEYR